MLTSLSLIFLVGLSMASICQKIKLPRIIGMLIDRSDRVMNLCEMKYSGEEFVIDKAYDKTLRSRMALFRRSTKNKKDFRCTFITTYGVKKNSYSSIADNEITMDDLFV